jgi:hypothetical protein
MVLMNLNMLTHISITEWNTCKLDVWVQLDYMAINDLFLV